MSPLQGFHGGCKVLGVHTPSYYMFPFSGLENARFFVGIPQTLTLIIYAITTRGFSEADCVEVTKWICAILDTIGTDAEQSTVAEVKAKALELCSKRPIY